MTDALAMCVWDFSSYVVSRPVYVFLISTISLPIPFTLMYRFIYALFAWKTRKFPHTRVAWSACSAFAFWRSDVLWARWMLWFLRIALTTEWVLWLIVTFIWCRQLCCRCAGGLTNESLGEQIVPSRAFLEEVLWCHAKHFFELIFPQKRFLYAHLLLGLSDRARFFALFLHVLTYHCVICSLSAFYEPT